MSTSPTDRLEARATEERNQLHQTATELAAEIKTKVHATREKLDIAKKAREHFGRAAFVAAVVGLISGYGFGGMFTRN